MRRRCAQHRHRQSRIVGQAIIVEEAALDALFDQSWHPADCLRAREPPMRRDAPFPRKPVIQPQSNVEDHRQADAIGRRDRQAHRLARGVVERQQEGQRTREVWRIAQQPTALMQPLAHQGNVELRQVADAAVEQFGRAAAGPAGEVGALDQPHAIAARHRVQGDARAGDPAADHQHVKRLMRHRLQVRAPRLRVQMRITPRIGVHFLLPGILSASSHILVKAVVLS